MSTIEQLEQELLSLRQRESDIDGELVQYFRSISSSKASYDSVDLEAGVSQLEKFHPFLEILSENSKKLAVQVEDCCLLSDKMSSIVRRLDAMQIRAQRALACTEDIINLKDYKIKLQNAIEERNLTVAAECIRQVHDIGVEALSSAEDSDFHELESSVQDMVRSEFSKAIEASSISEVMTLCPLLQTLGLETEARDSFLQFAEETVFIAVSADASSVDGATDAAMGYAQALSNVFNSTCMILQQYLPLVIQGLGNSFGDVYFIRRLHARCEKEAGLVLKRYVKYRKLKEVVGAIKAPLHGTRPGTVTVTQADMHVILDEIALLVQYCCMYSKYLGQLCQGADSRLKQHSTSVAGLDGKKLVEQHPLAVFQHGPTEFDKMVDDLVNRYHMEGERWLMRQGLMAALKALDTSQSHGVSASMNGEADSGLDECFYVLKRCGQRTIATNNIHAACAVLHLISDLLASDLLGPMSGALTKASNRVNAILADQIGKYLKSIEAKPDSLDEAESKSNLSKLGLQGAISLASSLTGNSSSSSSTAAFPTMANSGPSTSEPNVEDPWGTASTMHIFNQMERCIRYIERLGKDIYQTGVSVFGGGVSDEPVSSKIPSHSHGTSTEMAKLRLCKEDFDAVRVSYEQTIRQAIEKMCAQAQNTMKEVLNKSLGPNGPLGGIRFDLSDDKFHRQEALSLLPRLLVVPFESIISTCSSHLSEANKDAVVGALAESCCERLEHFISQTTFRFDGAVKFEELARALMTLFAAKSVAPIRSRFSRLREVLMVLTADANEGPATGTLLPENFSHLTANEILVFFSYRIDSSQSAH